MLTSVLKEITSVRKFFESRSSDADPTSLQHSFADAIIHKIGMMKDFGAMDAAKINETLCTAIFLVACSLPRNGSQNARRRL